MTDCFGRSCFQVKRRSPKKRRPSWLLMRGVPIVTRLEVEAFSIRDRAAGIDRQKLSSADLARENCVLAGFGIEIPLRGGVFRQRNRKRIIIGADVEDLGAISHRHPAIHLIELFNEGLQRSFIFGRISRLQDGSRIRPQD